MDSVTFEQQSLGYLIHHIILPRQCPQKIEEHHIALEQYLLEYVDRNLRDFVNQVPSENASAWTFVSRMVTVMVKVQKDGELQPDQLRKSLRSLNIGGGYFIPTTFSSPALSQFFCLQVVTA